MTDHHLTSQNTAPQADTLAAIIDRGKSDYARLLNLLRAMRRDKPSKTHLTNRMFVSVLEDSPLFASVTSFATPLHALRIAVESIHVADREPLPHTTFINHLQRTLAIANKMQLEFSKPFICTLEVIPGDGRHVYQVYFNGTSNTGNAVTCTLPDSYLRFIGLTDKLDVTASDLAAKAVFNTLVVREDQALSLQCFLDYYGIKIPLEPSHDDLSKAIAELLPKESRSQEVITTAALPFTLPEQPRFVLDTSRIYSPQPRAVDEYGTDNYNVIADEIKKEIQGNQERYRKLLEAYQHFGASLETNEKALLAMFQEAGGITLKLIVYDSDGQNNIYHEQHTANPWKARDLSDYFQKAQQELSSYMINIIRYGEDEGAINIENLIIEMIVPNITLQNHHLQTRYIEALDIRAKQPPFLYLDPLSKDAYAIISAKTTDITNELRKANWNVAQSATLTGAAQKLMSRFQEDLPSRTAAQRKTAYRSRLKEVVNVYYALVAETLESQQRLKIVLQPTQPEFASRAICRYLGLDEHHWGVIAQTRSAISYEAGAVNTGTFVRHETSAGYRTLLSVVYDEDLRREMALADDRDTRLKTLTESIAKKTKYVGDLGTLQKKLEGIFDANIAFVINNNLPKELTQPKETFQCQVEAYTLKATDEFRALEAERILLTSSDATRRLKRNSDSATADTDKPFHSIELLTDAEKSLLETRTLAFAAFLRARTNNDDIQDMSTSAQHVLQLVHQVGGLIPVVGNFINLAFDIYDGNTEAIALDVVNIIAELVLVKFRALPPRVLGTLMLQGSNLWMLVQQSEALNASLKANDYAASMKNLGLLLLGMRSALHCGASIVHGFNEAAALHPLDTGAEQARVTEVETGASANSPHWIINDEGKVSPRQNGRKVTHVDWNGNALVEGGARAVLLGGINERLYMLNGEAHRTVMGLEGPELRPLHLLDIEAGLWQRKPPVAGGVVEFSRFVHTESFPSKFKGRPERRVAATNAASWYDNCITAFEELPTDVTDPDGKQTRQNIAIGVIEQKYLTRNNGHFEVLEHAGSTDGKTTFMRVDGSRLIVSTTLPAIPEYKSEIKASIIAAQGMFVTVELSETMTGLTGKKRVAGVLATLTTDGGQELIIEADRGMHYRGSIAAEQVLSLAPGETSTGQKPIALTMKKISPDADPKRASPALWREQPEYRSSIAHDDFALELFYGAKAANEAYARHPQWVEKNMAAVGKIKAQLPESIRTVENPFYVLDTREEQAILFAPRNQAALANTLLGNTIEWGQASTPRPLALGEKVLRQLRLEQPLLAANESIPPVAADRTRFNRQLKQALNQQSLLLAEVEGVDGKKACFAHSPADNLSVTSTAQADDIYLSQSGSIVDHIEATYPDPAHIKSIVVLSVDEVSESDARRLFLSSQRGYNYESVTSLEPPAVQTELTPEELQLQIGDVQYADRARAVSIASAVVDLSNVTPVASGPQKGSYVSNGRSYVKLDNGRIYRAWWDAGYGVFVLVPPTGKLLASALSYPWVRHTGGHEFTLINRPGIKGGNWRAQSVSGVRIRNYERLTRQDGQLLASQRRDSREIQIHSDDLSVFTGSDLQKGKLNVPDKLFDNQKPNSEGYVTLRSKITVPESCISSTEYLISRYAGGTSGFDYHGERSGEAKPVVPNVEVVAHYESSEVSLNISTTGLDSWIEGQGYSDYFTNERSFPDIGEGIGFIRRHDAPGQLSSEYDFHFMFIAGKVLDQSGKVTSVLATDLSEPARATVNDVSTTELPATRNWNVKLYRSIDEMRGAADPEQNYYAKDQYYSVLVRPVTESAAELDA